MELETVVHIKSAFHDDRGDIYNVFEGMSGHISHITSKKGSVRANHYHKEDVQYIYLVSGAYDSYSHPLNKPEEMKIIHVKPGDIVKTPPLVAHAQKFTEDSVFIAISTRMREEGKYENDTIAYPVIQGGYLNKKLQQAK